MEFCLYAPSTFSLDWESHVQLLTTLKYFCVSIGVGGTAIILHSSIIAILSEHSETQFS